MKSGTPFKLAREEILHLLKDKLVVVHDIENASNPQGQGHPNCCVLGKKLQECLLQFPMPLSRILPRGFEMECAEETLPQSSGGCHGDNGALSRGREGVGE